MLIADLDTSGSTLSSSEYRGLGSQCNFLPHYEDGQITDYRCQYSVEFFADDLYELTEQLIVSIFQFWAHGHDGVIRGWRSDNPNNEPYRAHRISVINTNPLVVSVVPPSQRLEEGDRVTFTVASNIETGTTLPENHVTGRVQFYGDSRRTNRPSRSFVLQGSTHGVTVHADTIENTLNESDFEVSVNILDIRGGGIGIGSSSVRVFDDDPIYVGIFLQDPNTVTVEEGDTVNILITITGGGTTNMPVTVPYTLRTNSAYLNPDDYDISSSSAMFPAATGQTSIQTVAVTIIDDDINEGGELFILEGRVGASQSGGRVLYGDQNSRRVQFTIAASDPQTVSIAPAAGADVDADTPGTQVNEGDNVTLTVTLSGESQAAASVAFSVSPSADAGANSAQNPDYTVVAPAIGNTVTIPAGAPPTSCCLSPPTSWRRAMRRSPSPWATPFLAPAAAR